MRGPRGTGTKNRRSAFRRWRSARKCHGKTHGGALVDVDGVRAELALREEQVATLIGWLRLKLGLLDTR